VYDPDAIDELLATSEDLIGGVALGDCTTDAPLS
jgi:hypothetical protein